MSDESHDPFADIASDPVAAVDTMGKPQNGTRLSKYEARVAQMAHARAVRKLKRDSGIEERRKKYERKKKFTSSQLGAKRVSEILVAAGQGVPHVTIAAQHKITKQAVSVILQRFEPVFQRLRDVKDYRTVKSELLSASELVILESLLDRDAIEGANLYQRAMAFKILDNTNRLERGQATAHIAHAHATLTPKDRSTVAPDSVATSDTDKPSEP